MSRRLVVRLHPDGRVEAETQGLKGHACTKYIKLLEEWLQAEVVHSERTQEYFEQAVDDAAQQDLTQRGDLDVHH